MSLAIANDLAVALDPSLVMRSMGFEPDAWQLRFLRSTHRRALLNIHRQAGKSTVVGALAAHTAVYTPTASSCYCRLAYANLESSSRSAWTRTGRWVSLLRLTLRIS